MNRTQICRRLDLVGQREANKARFRLWSGMEIGCGNASCMQAHVQALAVILHDLQSEGYRCLAIGDQRQGFAGELVTSALRSALACVPRHYLFPPILENASA